MPGGFSKLAGGRWIACLSALAATLAVAATAGASATPGQLDRSFGQGGIGGGEVGPHYAATGFEAVAAEPDGSLLATRNGKERRYFPDGALDTGFAPREPKPPAVEAMQADGKLLVAENSGWRGQIRRLNPDGTPDASFNGGTSEPTASYWVEMIVPLPSGQILVAGTADQPVGKSGLEYRTGLSRLNPDGRLDRGFGDDGSVYLLREEVGSVIGLVPQPDGGILAVGSSGAFRLTATGKLDPRYRAAGDGEMSVLGFRALPGGGVAVAGTIAAGSEKQDSRDFFAAQYRADGQLDPGFGAGKGIATADFGGTDIAHAVVWNADGSVLVGGADTRRDEACARLRNCIQVPTLARFTAAGNPDPGFGSGGLLRIEQLAAPFGRSYSRGGVKAIAARGGGAIAVGSAGPAGSVAFMAAIAADGTLDPGFGSAGIVRETNPAPSSQTAGPVAIAPGGGILVGGGTTAGPGAAAALFRFSPNGRLDAGYGEAGIARLPGIERVLALTVGRSGNAVVLGKDGELVRVTAAGTVDLSFGERGLLTLDRPRDRFEALALLPNGKILVAGTSRWQGRRSRMLVVRLLRSGRPDPSFGKRGFGAVGCQRQGRCAASRIAVQADDRIVLAGRVQKTGATARHVGMPSRLAVARMLPSGVPDDGFGDAGLATLRVGSSAAATALALSGDAILVAGWGKPSGARASMVLARYRPDGRLDRGFGERGVVRRAGADEPTAVLPTPRRIVLLAEKGPRPALAFRREGRPDPDFVRTGIGGKGRQSSAFEGALQGDAPVVAWTEANVPGSSSPTLVQLARLRNG